MLNFSLFDFDMFNNINLLRLMIQEKGEGGLKGYTYNLIFNISRIMAGDGGWVGNNKADSPELTKRSQLSSHEYEEW